MKNSLDSAYSMDTFPTGVNKEEPDELIGFI